VHQESIINATKSVRYFGGRAGPNTGAWLCIHLAHWPLIWTRLKLESRVGFASKTLDKPRANGLRCGYVAAIYSISLTGKSKKYAYLAVRSVQHLVRADAEIFHFYN
jgi:hypothetical protein